MPIITQDEERNNEHGVRIVVQSAAYTQPWCHRIKDGVVSSFGESNCVGGDTDSSTAPQSCIC
ncbi:hypothetical protein HanIR_Chr05g0242011 [Helianthus annuus]|nr:hypothetical protein HanIR_Chr05g0242011 [Helianthus annuus]